MTCHAAFHRGLPTISLGNGRGLWLGQARAATRYQSSEGRLETKWAGHRRVLKGRGCGGSLIRDTTSGMDAKKALIYS